MYYANALTARDRVKAMIAEMESPLRAVIFDMDAQEMINVTSRDIAKSLVKELHGNGIEVYVAEAHAPVLEIGNKIGLAESIGQDHAFPTVDAAVRFIEMSA